MFPELPKNTEGMSLPSIRVWNDFWKGVSKTVKEDFHVVGSVDNLLLDNPDALCTDCGNKFIRTDSEISNGYFISALVYCPNIGKEEHSKKGWLEVWPNANVLVPREKRWELTVEEKMANAYRFSDPRIKECYGNLCSLFHNMLLQMAAEQGIKITEKPKPLYTHK